MPGEFALIDKYFARATPSAILGPGDDCALLQPTPGKQLAITTDMLVAGTHFLPDTDPKNLGWKALAVNISDLAAMGATPRWALLACSLPAVDEPWIAKFAEGFFACAAEYGVDVVGGDTTRGPLTIGVQIMGLVARGAALRRAGARPGDEIYVTGTLGDAALGLQLLQGGLRLPEEFHAVVVARLERPTPRVAAGQRLHGLATACIDISDGLLGDLGHILDASGVGARIELARLPLSLAYDQAFAQVGWEAALAGGDDYELCFTVPPEQADELRRAAVLFGVSCTRIGVIEAEPGLRIVDQHGAAYAPKLTGFDHFRGD